MSRKKTHSELYVRLKALRKAWGFSQKKMAIRANIAISTYQYYERGERDTPSEILYLLTTYGVNAEWLLTGEGEMFQRYVEGDEPEISELLKKARKVLKSGNKVAQEALESGIHYFFQAIDDLESMKETKKRQKNMESRMAALETRLKRSEEIRKEDLPELQEELLKLRSM